MDEFKSMIHYLSDPINLGKMKVLYSYAIIDFDEYKKWINKDELLGHKG